MSQVQRSAVRRRPYYRPFLESLEERRVPSVFGAMPADHFSHLLADSAHVAHADHGNFHANADSGGGKRAGADFSNGLHLGNNGGLGHGAQAHDGATVQLGENLSSSVTVNAAANLQAGDNLGGDVNGNAGATLQLGDNLAGDVKGHAGAEVHGGKGGLALGADLSAATDKGPGGGTVNVGGDVQAVVSVVNVAVEASAQVTFGSSGGTSAGGSGGVHVTGTLGGVEVGLEIAATTQNSGSGGGGNGGSGGGSTGNNPGTTTQPPAVLPPNSVNLPPIPIAPESPPSVNLSAVNSELTDEHFGDEVLPDGTLNPAFFFGPGSGTGDPMAEGGQVNHAAAGAVGDSSDPAGFAANAAADAAMPDAQPADLVTSFQPIDPDALAVVMQQYLDQVSNLGENLASLLATLGPSAWIMAGAIAVTACELVRHRRRRQLQEAAALVL